MLNLPSVLRPIYMSKNVIHLDCTLRDGGYYTDWDFTSELINEYLHAVNAACVDYELAKTFVEKNLIEWIDMQTKYWCD